MSKASTQLIKIQNLPESFEECNGQWAVIVGYPVEKGGQYFVELLDGKVICVYDNQMKIAV